MPTSDDDVFDGLHGHLIRRAQQLHVALWSEVGPSELTSPQYAVLTVLRASPQLDQTEVGARASLDRSTLAEMVSRLERRGLVARRRDPGDGRRNLLELTATGAEVQAAAVEPVLEVNRRLVAALDADDRTQLAELLERLVATAERER
jgi:DNA-binding MarR family transcriptional regulator